MFLVQGGANALKFSHSPSKTFDAPEVEGDLLTADFMLNDPMPPRDILSAAFPGYDCDRG